MPKQILVAMKRGECIEEIIPYLKQVVQAGMRVVFLIPYPVELRVYLRDHWVTTESVREAVLSGGKIMDQYSWEMQGELAEQKISLARQVLQNRGVDIAVDVYTRSLRRVIEDYTANGDVHLIMMRAGIRYPLAQLLSRAIDLFGAFRRPNPSPVLLLHTNNRP